VILGHAIPSQREVATASAGLPLKGAKESASLIMKRVFGFIAGKALDHTWGLARFTSYAAHACAGRI